jgi:YidC/Oxa1 family membrane protein insertase
VDTKKLILYAALGIVCVSIYSAWQKDYGYNAKIAAASISNNTQMAIDTGSNREINEVAAVPKTPQDRIVKIQTDTLDLEVDTLGGSIISAKLLKYPESIKNKNTPMQILSDDIENLYIAQSDLSGLNKNYQKQLSYRSAQKKYILSPGTNALEVNLVCDDSRLNNITIVKTLKFTKGSYAVDINYKINNLSKTAITNAQMFAQIKRMQPKSKGGFLGLQTYDGAAISSPDKPYEKINYAKIQKNNLSRDILGGWVAMQQRYFLSAFVPDQNKTHHYYSNYYSDAVNKIYTIGMTTPFNLASGSQTEFGVKLYIGPEIEQNLTELNKTLKLTIDYGWLWIISVGIFWVMQQIYNLVGNWGMAIILVTVLIKALFWKLSATSYKSSAKMRLLTPKMQLLKERYSDDRRKLGQATMELYKSEKINPASGCLPMLVQIPVFIALYYVLIESVQLHQAPFMLWINDLSAKDPYYVLPILMGISMFVQQKLNPAPSDPAQAKMFMLMPIIFTVLFASFPSGLVLYWLVNNLISVLQQWHIIRIYAAKRK